SFTPEHGALCARLAKEAVLLFDADRAGKEATEKVAQFLLGKALAVRVAALPAGKDPDELLKTAGANALKAAVENAKPIIDVVMAEVFDGDAGELSVDAQANAARRIAPLLF